MRRYRAGRAPRPRLGQWSADLAQDLHYAWRQLARSPGLSTLVIATLAIGIGANVTMAGVIDRLLLRGPVGVEDADRLARLVGVTPEVGNAGDRVGYPMVLELGREVPAFAGVAAFSSAKLPLDQETDGAEVEATLVTPNYFSLLGVRPALGRLFGPGDGFPEGTATGGPPLAVLADGFWRRQFGGDPGVIGRVVQVGQLSYTVVGVASAGFRGLATEPADVWLPLPVAADVEARRFILEDHGASWLTAVARLRPGASRAVAGEQATHIWRRSVPRLPQYEGAHLAAASLIRARGPDRPREVNVTLWLAGVSSLVLLIACANVTNLLLARAFARRREIAVRLALGASRARLARQLVVEAGLLVALGAVAALLLADVGASILGRNLGTETAGGRFVDARLVAFTGLIALGTTMLVGLAPLLLSAIPDLSRTLRGSAGVGGGRSSRARAALLGAQAAICMLLLVMAGLFAQSLQRVTELDLGLDPGRTLVVNFNLGPLAMTDADRAALHIELRERVRGVPGVAGVAFSQGSMRAVNVHTDARNASEHIRRTNHVPYEIPVDSGYFSVLGSRLRGRDFSTTDVKGAPPVTIINAPLAELLFPGEDALGRCVYVPVRADDPSGPCFTVVGVLEGYIYGRSILERDGLQAYTPLAQIRYNVGRPQQLYVRLDRPAASVIPALRQAMLGVRPGMPRLRILWMRDMVEPELRPWRAAAAIFSLFGVVALVVAAVGLYAVVSFTATQRTQETAVRLALGARLGDVMLAVAGGAVRAVAAGLALGLVAALIARHWVGQLLFQTSPADPLVMVGGAAVLCVVALLAAAVPTLRAAHQDPAAVLRVE